MRRANIRLKVVKVKRGGRARLWVLALLVFTALAFIYLEKPFDAPAAKPVNVANAPRLSEDVVFDALSCHAVQLGAYESVESARVEAARYVARGAAGYIVGDDPYRIIGACYESAEDAAGVAARLAEDEGIDATVYSLEGAATTLRVTATRDQIAALRNADTAMRALSLALNRAAFSLDKGELGAYAARSELYSLLTDVAGARDELKRLSGETPNPIAAGLIDMLNDAAATLEITSGEPDIPRLTLSSRVKHLEAETRFSHVKYLNELSN